MYISYVNFLWHVLFFFNLVTLTLDFDLLLRKRNQSNISRSIQGRTSIIFLRFLMKKVLHFLPWSLTVWLWPRGLSKISYFIWQFLATRSFFWYQICFFYLLSSTDLFWSSVVCCILLHIFFSRTTGPIPFKRGIN